MHFWFSYKNKRFKETHFIFAFTISILYSIYLLFHIFIIRICYKEPQKPSVFVRCISPFPDETPKRPVSEPLAVKAKKKLRQKNGILPIRKQKNHCPFIIRHRTSVA